MAMVGSGTQGQTNTCPSDWLLIGCIRVADRVPPANACEDRVCGGTFNAEVSTLQKTVQSNLIYREINYKRKSLFFIFKQMFVLFDYTFILMALRRL